MHRGARNVGNQWWSGARGCSLAAIVLLMIVAALGGFVITLRPLNQAVETRETLAELYGPQDAFTPRADGVVTAARMEAFLAVRQRLAESCAELSESVEAIEYVEEFEWLEKPPKRQDFFTSQWERAQAALGLETRRGEFWRARNEALLEAEMGLGEYTYLFVIAYSAQLLPEPPEREGVRLEQGKVLRRVRRLLLETLQRQLAAVETESGGAADGAWAKELAAEVSRLQQDPRRIPWMDGLPAQIEASVAPYRERLDAVLCEATLRLELIRNERKGLSIHGH